MDISMCKNDICPINNLCHRYMIIPDKKHQSYVDFKYVKDEGCNYFIRIKDD